MLNFFIKFFLNWNAARKKVYCLFHVSHVSNYWLSKKQSFKKILVHLCNNFFVIKLFFYLFYYYFFYNLKTGSSLAGFCHCYRFKISSNKNCDRNLKTFYRLSQGLLPQVLLRNINQ